MTVEEKEDSVLRLVIAIATLQQIFPLLLSAVFDLDDIIILYKHENFFKKINEKSSLLKN